MSEHRLGDIIDDYCAKCKRLMNHAIVAILETAPAKVRCRTCYHEHAYLFEKIPPTKAELRKQALFNEVLAGMDPAAAAEAQAQADAQAALKAAPAKKTRG